MNTTVITYRVALEEHSAGWLDQGVGCVNVGHIGVWRHAHPGSLLRLPPFHQIEMHVQDRRDSDISSFLVCGSEGTLTTT